MVDELESSNEKLANYKDLNPQLDNDTAVIIGNGNVAIDIVRVLSKTSEEMMKITGGLNFPPGFKLPF